MYRTEFTEALSIVGVNQNDADILDRLFTMYDKTGKNLSINSFLFLILYLFIYISNSFSINH
jgi:hypothetical protein